MKLDYITTVTLNPAIDRAVMCPDFAIDKVNKVEHFTDRAGGKGVNVAEIAAQFGLSSCVTGLLGEDNPDRFKQAFQSFNADNDFIYVRGETRTNIKVSSDHNRITDLNFLSFEAKLSDIEKVMKKIEAADSEYVVIAGSLPKGLLGDTYHTMIEQLQQQGRKVIFDSSGSALSKALKVKPYFIKPNKDELEEILGVSFKNHEDIKKSAMSLVDMGITNVVVSLGEEGAIFANKEQQILASAPVQSSVVSTVGAGDSLVAAWLIAQIKKMSPEKAIQFAIAISAHSVTHLGVGKSPSLSEAQLKTLMDTVQLTYL